MGSVLSKVNSSLLNADSVKNLVARKRKFDADEDMDSDEEMSENFKPRKKLKKTILSTPQYIYRTLFRDGTDSDITVCALNHSWKLHKVYLCQSPYFASMFSGAWKETNDNVVNIEIPDPNITVSSLSTVFGSLYLNELVLECEKLVSVLATATLFQLDSVVERCAEAMIEAINCKTALNFYTAAVEYGVISVKENAFKWLLVNLLTCLIDMPQVLSTISTELMIKLVSDPKLFVVQTETSLYYMLQIWTYCKVHPDVPSLKYVHMLPKTTEYFQNQPGTLAYLETEKGRQFSEPYRHLRFQHLINQHEDVRRLRRNRIIPVSWFEPAIISSWSSFMLIDQGVDKGPKECTEEEFTRNCLRCGREFFSTDNGDHIWRWTGFLYGLDLVWVLKNKTIKLRRNCKNGNQVLCMRARRYFVCRITVVKLDANRQIDYVETSGLKFLSLTKNEETVIMKLEKDIEYPVYLLADILISNHNEKTNSVSG